MNKETYIASILLPNDLTYFATTVLSNSQDWRQKTATFNYIARKVLKSDLGVLPALFQDALYFLVKVAFVLFCSRFYWKRAQSVYTLIGLTVCSSIIIINTA
jgi:hypothetical protein